MVNLMDFGINAPNVGNFASRAFSVLLVVIIISVVGFIAFWLIKKKGKKTTSVKKIGWWEEVHSELVPTTIDEAEEITIPGTRLKVFYIKSKNMWLPRFTRGITKDLFYVVITPQREIVNFTLGSVSQDMEKAGLNYDHTDMIWASENIKEFVKRNYRDKSVKWWQAYQGVITVAIYLIIMTFCLAIILYFMKQLVGDLRGVVSSTGELMKQLNSCYPQGSGIASA